ncbi:MAG: nitrogen fixation protein NifH, partial [Chloroflexota bacterium]
MAAWQELLHADPLPWLLDEQNPAMRHLALCQLLGRPADDPEVVAARQASTANGPIAGILAAMDPAGYWVKSGPGYGPKYTSTVWSLLFLAQLGADPAEPRLRRACEYVLSHSLSPCGGFSASSVAESSSPPDSAALHCLNGNLAWALLSLGWGEDARLRGALAWQARAISGEGGPRYYASGTSGPGFACAANEKQPCAWGSVKGVLALAAVPPAERSPELARALAAGVDFLLSRDPAVADYPRPSYSARPNGSWFKPGFPSAYVTDVLEILEA